MLIFCDDPRLVCSLVCGVFCNLSRVAMLAVNGEIRHRIVSLGIDHMFFACSVKFHYIPE